MDQQVVYAQSPSLGASIGPITALRPISVSLEIDGTVIREVLDKAEKPDGYGYCNVSLQLTGFVVSSGVALKPGYTPPMRHFVHGGASGVPFMLDMRLSQVDFFRLYEAASDACGKVILFSSDAIGYAVEFPKLVGWVE